MLPDWLHLLRRLAQDTEQHDWELSIQVCWILSNAFPHWMVVTWRLIAKTPFLESKSMAGLPSLLSANYWKFPCASNVCVYVCQPLWKGPQPDSQWNICVIMSTCVAYQLVLVQWYLMAICLAFEAIWIHLAYHDDQMHSQPLNTSNSK